MNLRSFIGTQLPLPQLRQSSKIQIGLVSDDAGTTRGGLWRELWRNNHTQCLRGDQLMSIAGVADKTQLTGTGRGYRRQAMNRRVTITVQRAAQSVDNVSERHRHANTI